jgi:hypothetical protein
MAVSVWLDIKDHDGMILETFEPNDITITYRRSDIGDNECKIALSDPKLARDLFAPRRTDFIYKISTDGGLTFDPIQGGICAPIGLKTREDFVTIKGVDWLAWLEQPYHFAGYAINPSTWTETDIIKYWVNQSQQTVLTQLLAGMYDGTSQTIHLIPSFSGSGWLNSVSYSVMVGDTTNVIDQFRSIGNLAEPYGFDFVCDWDKTVRCFSPKRSTVESAVPIAIFAPSYVNGLLDIDWANEGPLATATVGMPTAATPKYYSYAPSRAQFRKWLEIVSFNETIRTNFAAQQATNDIGGYHSNPQKKNTITILPDRMDPFDETVGFYNHCGRVVYVDSEDMFMPYHKVDAPYIIASQELSNTEGNWTCKFTLDQIY